MNLLNGFYWRDAVTVCFIEPLLANVSALSHSPPPSRKWVGKSLNLLHRIDKNFALNHFNLSSLLFFDQLNLKLIFTTSNSKNLAVRAPKSTPLLSHAFAHPPSTHPYVHNDFFEQFTCVLKTPSYLLMLIQKFLQDSKILQKPQLKIAKTYT